MLLALGGALLATTQSWGGALAWQQRAQSFRAEPGEKDVKALYVFHNASDRPVTITGVESSCGCTTAAPAKATYAPGEVGTIQAVFAIGELTGVQEKTLTVRTDEPGAEPDSLTLRVDIRERVALTSRWVVWDVGGEAVERRILCTAEPGVEIARLAIANPTSPFEVSIVTMEPGRSFELRVRPASLAKAGSALLEVQAEIAGAGPRVYPLFAYIR